MICRWTPDKKLFFLNETFCRFFDCSRDEIIGGSLESRILEEDTQLMKSSLARLNREEPNTDVEYRFRVGDKIQWTRWTHQAFFDDVRRVREIQSIISDMSRQKRNETNLRKGKNVLERHIRDRTAELEAKHKALKQKNLQIKRANFKTFQFGQAQGGAEISTTDILGIFRGLKFSPNAEIDRNGAF